MTQETFVELVLPMRRRFQQLARTFFGSREDAEDAVQDTLLRLWRLRNARPTEG